MKIHCIQHEKFEGLAFIEDWIKKNNHYLSYTNVFSEHHYPSDFDFEMLIIMGGSASIYATKKYSWLDQELAAISQAINYGKKV